jgi:hypothetical protein
MNTMSNSLHARQSAVALLVSALALVLLPLAHHPLTPLRLLSLGICSFGIWAFCDEMGLHKPLNRAGMVAFAMAAVSRLISLVDTQTGALARFHLLYAFGLMIAMLLWSAAYLHRQRELKWVGAVGALASLLPIVLLLAGHLALGAGAYFGFGALMAAAEGGTMQDNSALQLIDAVFAVWLLITSGLLWTGQIRDLPPSH